MFIEAWAYLPHSCNTCGGTIWWEWGLKEYGYDYYGWKCWRPGMAAPVRKTCAEIYADEVFDAPAAAA